MRPPEPVSRCNPESPPRLPEPLWWGIAPGPPVSPFPPDPQDFPRAGMRRDTSMTYVILCIYLIGT